MNEMKIEYLPVEALKLYERNAKKHPQEQVEHIANSIKEFGWRQPLVVDADNVLVIGHGRLLAAKKLGMETVPCCRADDLTEEQIKALRLADNKTNESDWELGLLDVELDDITDIDMSLFGFDPTIIDEGEIDAGEVEDKTKSKIAVKIIFPNINEWRYNEGRVREFMDAIKGVTISVGEGNEDKQGNA